MAYRMVQTGAKTQVGGLNGGLASPAYQPGMDGIVKKEPIIPASSHTKTKTKIPKAFFMRSSSPPPSQFKASGVLFSADLEESNPEGRRRHPPAQIDIIAGHFDPVEHLVRRPGDGQAFHWEGDLPVLNPEAGGAPAEVSVDRVDAVAGHLLDQQACLCRLNDVLGLGLAGGQVKLMWTNPR